MLWIAFRLYLWNIDFSPTLRGDAMLYVVNCFQIVSLKYWFKQEYIILGTIKVVNCFQIVSLKYWFQPPHSKTTTRSGCELLSDCIFEILISASPTWALARWLLWIAFRLYLWNIDFSLSPGYAKWKASCELLSDCIFEILISAYLNTVGMKSMI